IAFLKRGEPVTAFAARRYLTLSEENGNSIRSCVAAARDNARAARTALTLEAWQSINRAWQIIRGRASPGGTQATLNLIEEIKAEIRGFEGAVSRMLRTEGSWFVRLGSVIERGDNTARLLDVKYYLLLPPGQEVGGTLDRDQWTTILQIVSARTAYRHLYQGALHAWLVAEMLIFRREMPRSLAASAEETVDHLSDLAARLGRQGQADRLARQRLARMQDLDIATVFQSGLHEWLQRYVRHNAAVDEAIARQFRFA
ncbi:MAG: alpha-E domain-containing protein, partial [Allosphingosinicella sp.]